MAIELRVDNLDLVSRHRSGIFVGGTERTIVEQKLAPDVGTDERKILPGKAEFSRQASLQRPHRALSRGRRALHVHDDRPFLRRQWSVALAQGCLLDQGSDGVADG